MRSVCKTITRFMNSSNKQMEEAIAKYYRRNEPLPGYCTPEGSQKFTKIDTNIHQDHWRTPKYITEKLKLSSLGIGTQGGQPTLQADLKMFQVVCQSIKSGAINTIDTDINFRYGKSQKTVNAVLNYLSQNHSIPRSSIFLATKCGYVPNDIDSNLDEQAMMKILIEQGYITKQDIVNEVHSLHPNFIQFSIQKSLLSLGVQTIDLMYLNNPTEAQQTVLGKAQYFTKLEKAFETLEQQRSKNKIRYYGIASFVSFRSPPNEEGIHADLHEIIEVAKKIGGNNHGLRFILVPFNLGMPEVLMKWQVSSRKTEQHIFAIAEEQKVNINICCPLYQGRVANVPFKSEILSKIKSNAAKHLQLVRSIPKEPVLSTIFGTLNTDHLKQNMQVVNHPYLTNQEWRKVLPV